MKQLLILGLVRLSLMCFEFEEKLFTLLFISLSTEKRNCHEDWKVWHWIYMWNEIQNAQFMNGKENDNWNQSIGCTLYNTTCSIFHDDEKKNSTNACYLINFIVAPSNELQKRITSTHIIELSTIISLTNVITHEYCLFFPSFSRFLFFHFIHICGKVVKRRL